VVALRSMTLGPPSLARCALPLLVALLGGSPNLTSDADGGTEAGKRNDPAPAVGAVRVTLETIAVDRRGTWSVRTDDADIFSGSTGVLESSTTLIGRQASHPPREMIQLTARVTPELKEGAACVLRLETEGRSVVAGARQTSRPPPVERKRVSLVLKADEEKMVEVFSSSVTEGRLALKVRCGAPPSPSEGPGDEPRFIDITLSVARAEGDDELRPLKTNSLRAVLGREAGDLFSFNVPLEAGPGGGKRYRREKLEVSFAPRLISGGRLQVEAHIQGEVATVSGTEATVTHPLESRETLVLAPGETHDFDVDVASSGPQEGWSRMRYRMQAVCRF
jgi:hypothetical protein